MNDLGPEARSMLEAARGAEAPSRAERDRIKHAVLLRVATVGAVSAASMAAGGAAAMSVAAKITVAALTVAVLGGGTAAVWTWKAHTPLPAAPTRAALSHTARRTPPAPPVQPTVAPEPPAFVEAPRPQPLPSEVRRREVVRGEARRPNAAPVAESTPVPAPTLDSLDPELTALRQAQEDLRAGLPAQALRRLAEYDRRFGKGTLNQERQAIGAIALCQLRPGPAAQVQAERFLRAVPESPLAERVRAACQGGTTKPVNGVEPVRQP